MPKEDNAGIENNLNNEAPSAIYSRRPLTYPSAATSAPHRCSSAACSACAPFAVPRVRCRGRLLQCTGAEVPPPALWTSAVRSRMGSVERGQVEQGEGEAPTLEPSVEPKMALLLAGQLEHSHHLGPPPAAEHDFAAGVDAEKKR